MNLRSIIKEQLLLEKRIARVMSNLEVQFNFEIDRSPHAFERSTRPELEKQGIDYNQREISNAELKEFVGMFTKEIAEKIVENEIYDKVPFVLKSLKWELAVPIIPIHEGGTSWKLVIKTVFRESQSNPMKTHKDQLILWR